MGDIYHRGIMYDEREVNDMIKVAICDDEERITQEMERILEASAHEYGIQLESGVFYDGEQLIQYMDKNDEQFDIFFLDIEMQGLNGIETATWIRERDRKGMIIYVTSHDSYALEAYQVHPFYFLVKPLQEVEVRQCFEQAYAFIAQEDEYFEYTIRKNTYRKSVCNIMYFMSNKRMIEAHMQDGTIEEFYGKIDEVEEQLRNGKTDFWRVHKSTLVNAQYIFRKTYLEVELTNGEKLRISKQRARKMNELYVQNVRKKMEG